MFTNRSRLKKELAVSLSLTMALMPAAGHVKAASAKTVGFSVNKKSGTYQKSFKVKIKAKKGYDVYYTFGAKFKTSKKVKSGKTKSLSVKKTSKLKVVSLKKGKKITNKKLNAKSVKKKAKTYKYTIKKATATPTVTVKPVTTATPAAKPSQTPTATAKPEFDVKDGVLTGGDFDGVKTITIPEDVTEIGDDAFSGNEDIQAVYLTDGVKKVGKRAFNECPGLKRVYMSSSLKEIDDYAFFECSSLKIVEMTEGLERIGEGAFCGCQSLKEVGIPGSVTEIGDFCFSSCPELQTCTFYGGNIEKLPDEIFSDDTSLDEVVLPKGLKEIGNLAFSGCSSLGFGRSSEDDIYEEETDAETDGEAEGDETGDGTDDDPIEWYEPEDATGIPESVTAVGVRAYRECTFGTLNINYDTIKEDTFYGAVADKFEMGENVKTIKTRALRDFTVSGGESEIVIPSNVSNIEEGAFSEFAAASVEVDAANKYYTAKDGVLYDKDMKTLLWYPTNKKTEKFVVPDTVETIAKYAFHDTPYLKEVTIPASVKIIDDAAFLMCGDEDGLTLNLSEGLETIGMYAFYNAKMSELDIPDSVKEAGTGAFSKSEIKSVRVGNGLTKLAANLFSECKKLKKIENMDAVEEISATTFENCIGFDGGYEKLNLDNNPNFKVEDGVLFSKDMKKLIAYPDMVKNEMDDQYDDFDASDDDEEIYDYVDGEESEEDEYSEYEENYGEEDENQDENQDEIIDDYSEFRKQDLSDAIVYNVPEEVTEIEENAFSANASVRTIVLSSKDVNLKNKSFGYISSGAVLEGTAIVSDISGQAYTYCHENDIAFFTGDLPDSDVEISMNSGETYDFGIKNADKERIYYSTSDARIADVDDKGQIKAKANGTTNVFAHIGTRYFDCQITVTGGKDPEGNEYSLSGYDIGLKKIQSADGEIEYDDKDFLKGFLKNNKNILMDESAFPATLTYTSNYYTAIKSCILGEDSGYFKYNINTAFPNGYGGYGYRQYYQVAKNLQEELKRTKLHTNLVTFSGTTNLSMFTGGGESMAEMRSIIGKTITTNNVISTSLQHRVATGFAGSETYSTMLEFYLPEGYMGGTYVDMFSAFGGEKEYLLNAGLKMKVLDAGVRMSECGYERYLKLQAL